MIAESRIPLRGYRPYTGRVERTTAIRSPRLANRGDPIPRPGKGLRILAVGNMYPPQHAGGYEIAWQHAMRHARALGHDVRIWTTDYRHNPGPPEQDPDVHRSV